MATQDTICIPLKAPPVLVCTENTALMGVYNKTSLKEGLT